MKRKLMTFLTLFFFGIGLVMAQTQVRGTIVDEAGEPVIGASVQLKSDKTKGASTDMDGKFTLSVPNNAVLVVSSIGMKTLEVVAKPTMNITMKADTEILDEVVVTALGLKRSEKSLGYAASTVKSDNLDGAKTGSVMAGLTSKVAGVQISAAGNAGTSQKVLIRGISSLNSNSPLYIIDGVPIDNSRKGNSSADFGNGSADINSEDVESVTVLKGASATALYGSRAAQGVIMITTKKAGDQKLSVTYDGSFMASNVLRVMQTQNLFGQGWGSWDRAENGSWGPRLDGSIRPWGSTKLETEMTKPYSYVKNNLRNFYQTGFESNNNITLKYGTDKLGIVSSIGNLSSNGILPNDGDKFSRNTVSLRGFYKYNKLTFDMSMNYVTKNIRRTDGMNMELLQHGVDINYTDMKDYNDVRYNTDNYYTFYASNPYWMINNNKYLYKDERVYGKVEASYDILKGLKATARLGKDISNQRIQGMNAKVTYALGTYSHEGGKNPENGFYSNFGYNRGQTDITGFITANYDLSQDINMVLNTGINYNERKYSYIGAEVEGLDIIGWNNVTNTTSAAASTQYDEMRRLIGYFAQADFGYKNFLYLNLSARNDWSSTLPIGKNSFFYGGVNASMIISELLPALKERGDYLKIRGAYGKTGNDADVYKTRSWFIPVIFDKSGNNFPYTKLPIGGVSGLSENNLLPSQNLRPEMTTEYEIGLSGNFFKNRVSFDLALYNKMTTDQIINATLAPETGYTQETRNVGKLNNKGIEFMLNLTPIVYRDLKWDLGMTFTKNVSKVVELWDGLQEYTYTSWRGVDYMLRVGQPIGEFRLPEVDRVTDTNSPYYGYAIVDNNGRMKSSATEKKYVGKSQPDFMMGFNTGLNYKNFRLAVVADWRKGGIMVSNTSYITHFNGNSTQTLYNERNPFIYPKSVKMVAGTYAENNIPVAANQIPAALGNYSYSPLAREEFILPRDYFKLREVSLTYRFSKSLLAKTPISNASISLIGRNLLLLTPKINNYIDPEATNLGNDLLSEFGETTGTQSTRNYGASIKIEF